METMTCACCSAKLVPTTLTPFLTCEYCDTSIPNPHYDEAAAAAATAEAAKPDAAALALASLKEMGAAQNLAGLDRSCFGDPINAIDAARAGLSIPDDEQVYFLYEHTFLFVAFSDGLALTDGGVYYSCDSGKGSLSWEAFVTGSISCVDEADDVDGTLKIGSGVELAVKDEKDSRLARFLVDFHNHVYHQYTGETAPASWAVTEPAASAAVSTQAEGGSLLGSVLPGIGALVGSAILGTGTTRRTPTARTSSILRTPTVHPTSRPTVQRDRREHVTPPRPLNVPNHQRPTGRPGGIGGFGGQRSPGGNRPMTSRPTTSRPGGVSRPAGSQPDRMSGQRKPGSGSRPGGMGGSQSQRKPGGRR